MLRRRAVHTLRRRFMSDDPCAKDKPKCDMPQERVGACVEAKCSAYPNGMKLTATKMCIDATTTMAAVCVAYLSGSRYEFDDNIGASHFIRRLSDGDGCGYTGYTKTRFLQQWGGAISCSSNRDIISYTLSCPPSVYKCLIDFFVDTCARGIFTNYLVDERRDKIHEDLHLMHPMTRLIDLIQKASWGGALSNSVFCPEGRLDDIDEEVLRKYAKLNMRPKYCAIGTAGLAFEDGMEICQRLEVDEGRVAERPQSKHFFRGGFEFFDLGPKADTYIALAVPGHGTCDLKKLLLLNIIAHTIGGGYTVESSQGAEGILEMPLAMLTDNLPGTEISGFNISHHDTGIFGIVAKTSSRNAKHLTLKLAEFLACINCIDKSLYELGKRRLKLKLLMNDESSVRVAEALAIQGLSGVNLNGTGQLLECLDKITDDELSHAAKEISSMRGRMAYAVVGDLGKAADDSDLIPFKN